jgi:hypothetical protein
MERGEGTRRASAIYVVIGCVSHVEFADELSAHGLGMRSKLPAELYR